jgi:ATP-independent RNA helicase DbpA
MIAATSAHLTPGRWAGTGLSPHVSRAPSQLGWAVPTEIQSRCIRPILEGRDVVGQAETGSGKTAAYALPLVQRACDEFSAAQPPRGVRCLVIVPTRELCVQVSSVMRSIANSVAAPSGGLVRVGAVYGGTSRTAEAAALADPPHLLVATPGRLLDHLVAGHVRIDGVRTLVLDEADRLLELGFFEAAAQILDASEPEQLIVFSATLPEPVLALVDAEMRSPVRALVGGGVGSDQIPRTVRLHGVRLARPRTLSVRTLAGEPAAAEEALDAEPRAELDAERHRALHALLVQLCSERPGTTALIFCNTRTSAMAAWQYLCRAGCGVQAALLSGEMEQEAREQSLFLLRQRAVHALVATDLGARGLDVDGLDTVVNMELPPSWDEVTFLHRAGRTGRAGGEGRCFSLCATAEDEATLRSWVSQLGTHELEWADGGAGAAALDGRASTARIMAPPPEWAALRIGAGKRDKLSKGDVLGALTALTGLAGGQVGRIEVFPKASFVGVPRAEARAAVEALRAGKIKKVRRLVRVVSSSSVTLRADQRRPGAPQSQTAAAGERQRGQRRGEGRAPNASPRSR